MTYSEIHERLALKGISFAYIGLKFNCSRQNVRNILLAKPKKGGRPALIRRFVAEKIGIDYKDVFVE